MDAEPKLSWSEARILAALVAGEPGQITLDWLVVQHLKQRGLIEEGACRSKNHRQGPTRDPRSSGLAEVNRTSAGRRLDADVVVPRRSVSIPSPTPNFSAT